MPNKESALSQMAKIVSNQVLAGSAPMTSEDIMKVSDMMNDMTRGARTETGVRVDSPMWGGQVSDAIARNPADTIINAPVGIPGISASGTHTHKIVVDTGMIDVIISIRNKLDDFLDGSNVLIKVMHPQTIREMVREMRHEIRELKRDHGISELTIINHLEKELEDAEDRRADARTRIDNYDANNEVPF